LEQEFVVLGWKAGEGTKSGAAGSLLLGVRVGDPKLPPIWKACGRVGTGRDYAYWQQFTELEPASPGIDYDLGNASNADLKGVNWVEPTTVVQVQFQRWTKDGRLWHPALLHVRDDKAAIDVVRET
jgi:bifunctional non-homologous end joining protein LigD